MSSGGLRANRDFIRLWAAGTISVFGSLVTRYALPFAAISVANAGPIEISILRSLELVGVLLVGFAAGAWVDRVRRRPIMVAADFGRAILLGSVPLAAVAGVLGLGHLYAVAFFAAILSTFFDSADRAFLPSIVERDDLVQANSALTASSAAAEFSAFGVAGVLVQVFTAPIAIAVDAVSFVVSGLLIRSIRRAEPAEAPHAAREPLLREIRDGVRLVVRDPVLRALAGAAAAAHLMWGVFGASYILFATTVLGVGPALLGVIAAVGGLSSLIGAGIVTRATNRFGLGPTLLGGIALFAVGNVFIPIAPAGAIVLGAACLIVAQLLGDGGYTVFDVAAISLTQSLVDNRTLGRVTATGTVFTGVAQLGGTIAGGLIAVEFGLRTGLLVGLVGAAIAVALLWFSPVRHIRGGMPEPLRRALLPGEDLPVTE
jgi:Na+/melibiose symporter-like transporter